MGGPHIHTGARGPKVFLEKKKIPFGHQTFAVPGRKKPRTTVYAPEPGAGTRNPNPRGRMSFDLSDADV